MFGDIVECAMICDEGDGEEEEIADDIMIASAPTCPSPHDSLR